MYAAYLQFFRLRGGRGWQRHRGDRGRRRKLLPDIVLMDLALPRMDGWEATRRLKKNDPRTRHIPIVALTGHALAGHAEGGAPRRGATRS